MVGSLSTYHFWVLRRLKRNLRGFGQESGQRLDLSDASSGHENEDHGEQDWQAEAKADQYGSESNAGTILTACVAGVGPD